MSQRFSHAVALCAYLAIVLWTTRAVLPAPSDSYPLWVESPRNGVTDGDQSHMIWATSRNARTLLSAPTRLWDFEFCHPLSGAVALGHHLYAEGLMGVAPYAITGEPILTLNLVSIAMLWLSAAGMYALAFHWTGSSPAAFVAGALFALSPLRLVTTRWPSIVGNEWTPLALLYAHRMCVTCRWRDALGLAVFVGMQMLESFYQVVPIAVIGAVYAGTLLVRHRARLRPLLPKLIAVAAVATAVALVVAPPYLHARRAWSTMTGHQSLLPFANDFRPGTLRYPGTCLVLLAILGVVDRARRRRAPDDPRLPLLVGGLVLFSLVVVGIALPGGRVVPSLGALLIALVPGLDLVRGLQLGVLGVWLVLALLAAFGVLMVIEHRSPRTQLLLGVLLAAVAASEMLVPAMATASFGVPLSLAAARLDVPRDFVRLCEQLPPDGAVLDVPAQDPPLGFPRRAHYVLLAAFHRRPTSQCFTSFPSPIAHDLEDVAVRLPDPRAAEALFALGFRGVILHEEQFATDDIARFVVRRLGTLASGNPRLVEIGADGPHRLYRLDSTTPVHSGFEPLGAGATAAFGATMTLPLDSKSVALHFRNSGHATYRHPDPIEPSRVLVRWYDQDNVLVMQHETTMVLPLALAPGEATSRTVTTPVPRTVGRYQVTLSPAQAPTLIVARALVETVASLVPPNVGNHGTGP